MEEILRAMQGKEMHNFVLREIEIGYRAAVTEDSEYVDKFPPAILDIQFKQYIAIQRLRQSYHTVPCKLRGDSDPYHNYCGCWCHNNGNFSI